MLKYMCFFKDFLIGSLLHLVQSITVLRTKSGCVGDVRLGLELPASVDAACNLASSLHRRLTSSDDLPQAGGP